MQEDVEVVVDDKGRKIAKINNIIFRGKQNIDWDAVEVYLEKYIGKVVEISSEKIHIKKSFPDEFTRSNYTGKLRGGVAKAKANAAQGIVEMIKISSLKRIMKNKKEKHKLDAKYGWKYYETRFALPIYNEVTKTITYNIYKGTLVVACAADKKMYLYDMIEIKKETSTPPST